MTVFRDCSSSPTRLEDSDGGGDQAEPVLLDQDEAAGVGAGQVAQAGGDAVEHGLEVTLGVHLGDHVTEAADHPGALGHVVPGDVVLARLVADVDPADHVAAGTGQRAGVDAHLDRGAVLAGSPGGERHLAAAADPFQDGVVLGVQLVGDDWRLRPGHFRGAPAEHPLRGRVPEHDRPVGAERDDRVRRALDHRARGRVYRVPGARERGVFQGVCRHTFIVPSMDPQVSEKNTTFPNG